MTARIDRKTIERIRNLSAEGNNRKEIAEALKISIASVTKYLKEQNEAVMSKKPSQMESVLQTASGEDTSSSSPSLNSNGKINDHTEQDTALKIPHETAEKLQESIYSALRITLNSSMDNIIQKFTPENIARFLRILLKEEEENKEIIKLQEEINRLGKVKEGIDSEILDSIMRMSAIESRILNLEKRLGSFLSREIEDEH